MTRDKLDEIIWDKIETKLHTMELVHFTLSLISDNIYDKIHEKISRPLHRWNWRFWEALGRTWE